MKTFKIIKFAFGAAAIGLLSVLTMQASQGKTDTDVTLFGTDQVQADVPGGGDGSCDSGGDGDCQ